MSGNELGEGLGEGVGQKVEKKDVMATGFSIANTVYGAC